MVASGAKILASDINTVMPNSEVFNLFLGSTLTITGTAYANMTGCTLNFTKRLTASALKISVFGSGFANLTAAGYNTTYGMLINAVDYDILRMFWQTLNTHTPFAGVNSVASGLAAGTYAVQLRAKNSVASRSTLHDTSDAISFEVTEIPT